MVLFLLFGGVVSPAVAEKNVLPAGVYDRLFLVHLAIVAQDNCAMLEVSRTASDAMMTNATMLARAETGLSYPDVAAAYETSEFDREIGARVDRLLVRYPGSDICSAISEERKVDPALAKIVRSKNG